MPTRDEAAYKQAYEGGLHDGRALAIGNRRQFAQIGQWDHIGRVVGPDRFFGRLDGLIEAARERGLCASVLDWHKKPAGDELPW